MSRNSYRGLTFALVLIIGLGVALPALGKPAERALAIQEGLLDRLWNWVEHLWFGGPQPEKGLRPATEASGGSCDRGILIDPNGNPCNS